MDDARSPQQAKEIRAKEERADLVIRLTHVCRHLSRRSFNQLVDAMMVMRERDFVRLALDSAS